jgi:hypothetical protein
MKSSLEFYKTRRDIDKLNLWLFLYLLPGILTFTFAFFCLQSENMNIYYALELSLL